MTLLNSWKTQLIYIYIYIHIYIYNNFNLIFNTYAFLFFKLLLILFVLLSSFDHATDARRVSEMVWMVEMKMERIWDLLLLEIHKIIIDLKWSTNLPRHAPKWKSANHGLESRSDEHGIIKRSSGVCMKDQCWFWN